METPSRTRGRPVGLGSGLCFNRDCGPLASLPRPKCPRSYRVGAPRSISTFRDRPLFQTVSFFRRVSIQARPGRRAAGHRSRRETPCSGRDRQETTRSRDGAREVHGRQANVPSSVPAPVASPGTTEPPSRTRALEGRAHYFGSTAGVRPLCPVRDLRHRERRRRRSPSIFERFTSVDASSAAARSASSAAGGCSDIQ